jgi:putative DNA primase/helicase
MIMSNTIDAATIIAGLGGNLSTGMCRCPAHDDKNPSLHITEGSGGKPLFKCFAGCTQEDVLKALRQRGLWSVGARISGEFVRQDPDDSVDRSRDEAAIYWRFRNALAIRRAAIKAKDTEGVPTAYYSGRGIEIVPPAAMILPADASARYTGSSELQLQRSLPSDKFFRKAGRRYPAVVLPILDGSTDTFLGVHLTFLTTDKGSKIAGDKARQIFGSLKGGYIPCGEIDSKQSLVVGEGVESTLAAMQLSRCAGIAAVSASNMPLVRLPRCGEVIIAADNDESGRKAAEQLAERLEYEGVKVRIALPPVEGNDWNDVLLNDAGGVATWNSALSANVSSSRSRNLFALEEGSFMELAFPKRQQLLTPWLPLPGLAMIHAARGEGKTWFALAVGKAVANGQDLLGWTCPEPRRVLYIDGELPGTTLQERLQKFRRSPPGMFHVLCRDTFQLQRLQMPDLGEAEGRRELDRIIERCAPDLIIFDSISTLVRSGVENEADSWAPMQDWLLKHRWRGRTILLIHHEGRSGKPRGTSKREDVLDTMIGLRKKQDIDSTDSMFELTFTKARDFYGVDAEPLQLRFSMVDGEVTWSQEKLRNIRDEKIREMIDSGVKQTEIAKTLGLTKQRVGQIVKQIKKPDIAVAQFRPKRDMTGSKE